jgi:hypothetical protein
MSAVVQGERGGNVQPKVARNDAVVVQLLRAVDLVASLPYTGYVSHEWRPGPGRDPLKSIAECMDLMDV